MSNYLNLSFYDLLQIPSFKLAAKLDDKEAMARVLYEAGMDIDRGFDILWTTHRALTTNIPQENYLVMGYGRTDKEHIDSGHARLEDIIYSSKDKHMIAELESLNPRGSMIEGEYEGHEDMPELSIVSFEEGIVEEESEG
jgi:hypothetical protein